MKNIFDIRIVKALVNVLLLQGDNIFTPDADRLCLAIIEGNFPVIEELATKYL